MIRKKTNWNFRGYSIELGPRTLLMAILNVTPDSFSDGGNYADPDAAAARALELQDQGADILDIGAESTRPGSERVSEAEELRRLIPVLKRLKGKLEIPISVDTYKAGVAELALQHGANIINDVSGLTWEPELVKVVLQHDAGLILNHMRGTPETWAKLPPMRDVAGEILAELESSLHRATRAGIPPDHIVIDPGIGFGKRKEQNSEILARLSEFKRLPVPILVGPSRKTFLSQETAELTEFATAAAVTAGILNGAAIVRVHEPSTMASAIAVADAIVASIPERVEAPVTRVARPDTEGRMRETVFGEEAPPRPVRPPALKPKEPTKEPKDLPLLRPRQETPVEKDFEEAKPEGREPDRSDDRSEARSEARPAYDRGDRGAPKKDTRHPFRRDDRDAPPRKSYGPPSGDRGNSRGPGRSDSRPPFRRDDRGEGGYKRPSSGDRGGDSRPPFRRDDRGEGGYKRPSSGDRGGDSRPPFRRDDRGEGGYKRPSSGDRGGDSRPPFRRDDRGEGGYKRPSSGDRGGDSRPPFRRDDRGESGYKRPSSGDRGDSRPPARGGEYRGGGSKPPFRGGSDRGDSRPPFRSDRREGGERSGGGGNKPAWGRGDRPSSPFSSRPPRSGPRQGSGDDRGGPPRRPKSDGPGGPPAWKRSGPPSGPKGGGKRGPNTPPRRKG